MHETFYDFYFTADICREDNNDEEIIKLELPCSVAYFRNRLHYDSYIESQPRVVSFYCNKIEISNLNKDTNINELNYLSSLLVELSDVEFDKINAILQTDNYIESLKDLINVILCLDNFDYIPGITNENELAYYYFKDKNEDVISIDTIIDNENGIFVNNGYLACCDECFSVNYSGEIIPTNYRVC